jgi:ribonuclease HI
MAEETWTVRIDGASRGNPGPAAYAMVIERPGQPIYEEADCLGETTNNVAEYTALLKALERCEDFGGRKLLIFSDSELLVKQMNGEYRVKSEDLKPMYAEASERLKAFDRVTIRHVRRDQNVRADELCNAALDGRPLAPAATSQPNLRERMLDCLRRAAAAWARGDARQPTPEQVCDELWTILGRGGQQPR